MKVGATVNWFLPDPHGDIAASLTSAEDHVVNAIRYDAWGARRLYRSISSLNCRTPPYVPRQESWTLSGSDRLSSCCQLVLRHDVGSVVA